MFTIHSPYYSDVKWKMNSSKTLQLKGKPRLSEQCHFFLHSVISLSTSKQVVVLINNEMHGL
jgi:hypothetical protein